MLFDTPEAFLVQDRRAVLIFGMSGVGKTRLAAMLRHHRWFHYSVDYRIGTRYMGEHIVDCFKEEAMRSPILRDLLLSDSIYIGSNITFENLSPLSTYLGKPGDPARGGLPFEEYVRRQRQHRDAEIAAMLDTAHFFERAQRVYGYRHFLCDTSGSLCEVVDPSDPDDPVLTALSAHFAIVYIEEGAEHTEMLAARFAKDPKPMYYNEDFLRAKWQEYLAMRRCGPAEVDPDDFIRWGYGELLAWRAPRYRAIADRWGYTVTMPEAADAARNESSFLSLMTRAIERK